MLPASLQMPAAIVLLAGGLIACFAGYRVFRIVLGIYGFILGALFASSAMGTEHTLWMVLAALLGGIVGALILIAVLRRRRAARRGVGALAASLIWAAIGREPHALVVILFAIAGALAALALQRYVIIGATAFGGAWTVIVGGLALLGRANRGERRRSKQRLACLPDASGTGPAMGVVRLGRPGTPGRDRATGRNGKRQVIGEKGMATFSRNVTVNWEGSLMDGKGEAKAEAAPSRSRCRFLRRIGDPQGQTSPEELIAAAHASCYAMALNATVGSKGGSIAKTDVTATVTADKGDSGIKITTSKLTVVAHGLTGIPKE